MSSNKNQSDLNIPTNSASLKQKQRQQLGIKSEIGASTSDVYDPQVASYLSAGDSPSQFANTALHHSNSVGYSASAAAAAAELQHRAELQRRQQQQQLQQRITTSTGTSYNTYRQAQGTGSSPAQAQAQAQREHQQLQHAYQQQQQLPIGSTFSTVGTTTLSQHEHVRDALTTDEFDTNEDLRSRYIENEIVKTFNSKAELVHFVKMN